MSQNSQNTLANNALELVQVANTMSERLAAFESEKAAQHTKIAAAIPVVYDRLVEIGEAKKEASEQRVITELLGTHEGALQVLYNLSKSFHEHKQAAAKQASVNTLGRPATDIQMAANGMTPSVKQASDTPSIESDVRTRANRMFLQNMQL